VPEPARRAAIVVAHPDDEVVFFGGSAARLRAAGWQLDVVCVTGEFGSLRATGTRRAELGRAAWALGARARRLRLADRTGPLDEPALDDAFARICWDRYVRVYTHGVWGEYGHPHHIQVSRAAHRHGTQVHSLAGPFAPDVVVALTASEVGRKRELAARCYPSQPFAEDWCADTEHLLRLSRPAAEFLGAVAWTVATGSVSGTAPPPADLPALAPGAGPSTAPAGVSGIPAELWQADHRSRLDLLARLLDAAGSGEIRTAPALP
jgi:GlcNAc-PI de-N-acetylase